MLTKDARHTIALVAGRGSRAIQFASVPVAIWPECHAGPAEQMEVRVMAQLIGGAPSEEALRPSPEHKFTFGLWTVGNAGRDPFGDPTRARLDPNDSLRKLAQRGAYGVSIHDDDLVPFGTPSHERDEIVNRLKATLHETGMVV